MKAMTLAATGILLPLLLVGCVAADRLTFPAKPLHRTETEWLYDADHDGKPDFALRADSAGRIDELRYDDDQDGSWDRIYHLSDYPVDRVPHLIILLDSIPFLCVEKRWNAGDLRFFPRPQKVIGPFPSLSPVIFNEIMHAPPRQGTNNQSYDPRINATHGRFWEQVHGGKEPWQLYLHYDADYLDEGLGFVKPREEYARELARIRRALDNSPDRITIAYTVSTAGMACKYGQQGIDESLDGLQQLCLQLFYERQGAIKISVMADHGHNLVPSQLVNPAGPLEQAGLKIGEKIESDGDVVLDAEGLVTYVGIHTRKPVAAAEAMLKWPQTELVMYLLGERVIVRDAKGSSAIEKRGGKLRYAPIDHDVLDYIPVIHQLQQQGKADGEGFATETDWFAASVDQPWPDAPKRLWDAFHGLVVSPPEVMVTLKDGAVSGLSALGMLIQMASSHGGLNQVNSATFILSMTDRVDCPLRSGDVLKVIEPGYVPMIRARR